MLRTPEEIRFARIETLRKRVQAGHRANSALVVQSVLLPRTEAQREEREAIGAAGATLDVERCGRHGEEYPMWLTCPQCRRDSERKLMASHFIRKRFEAEANGLLYDTSEEDTYYRGEGRDEVEREELTDSTSFQNVFLAVVLSGALLVIGALMWAWAVGR